MKKVIFYSFLLGLIISHESCTKDFDKINTNPNSIAKVGPAERPFLFTQSINWAVSAGDDYQVAQNLFADLYSQYWANATTYFTSDRYGFTGWWIDQSFSGWYVKAVPGLFDIMRFSDTQSPEHALASVMWVYMFHNITDVWGPIPYFNAGKGVVLSDGNFVAYDAQDKIYDDFFKRLNNASLALKANAGKNVFGKNDLIYNGNVDKWLKFCNSLRLRLALRISKVDPARAKAEAEAAVAAGVFMSADDDALLKRSAETYDISHHLSVMSEWREYSMSASMESYLKGYDDPRMKVWFAPTVNSVLAGTPQYKGVRNGLLSNNFNDLRNKLDNNSIAGSRWNLNINSNALNTPQNVMCAAEAYFLRAEGALKGWNMNGSAQSLYEEGIRVSFRQWGINSDPSLYFNSASLPVPLNDFLNSPAVNSIPVKFSSSPATQLEQIMTQKWLSTFPDGFVGWSDLRRTGFPKLYPVPNSDNPDMQPGSVVRRLLYPPAEFDNNKQGIQIGVTLLSGPDKMSTRLWWDKP